MLLDYRARAEGDLRLHALDEFTLLYDRGSGQTHLLGSPMPELLDCLTAQWEGLPAILARLNSRFALDGSDDADQAVTAHLAELIMLGLIECRMAEQPDAP